MRCDYIAEGVIRATKELQLDIPLIVRLKGTKEQEAKQYGNAFHKYRVVLTSCLLFRMIRESGMKIIPFDSLDDAAEEAVKLAK